MTKEAADQSEERHEANDDDRTRDGSTT